MKATEQYFAVLLATLLYKVSLMFKPIEEILESESYWAVIFLLLLFYAAQDDFNFCIHGQNPKVSRWPFK